ncbi:hypothetical protein JTE90_026137 [Oedothorax gibbosus]|uniref:Uncharacterized protein n=1 Tax=Oedothorax gibbosus TaxID=931172 RepID=A0AAV6V1T5_9ARAC|nr:hypothetical protein JTE90_026137 [Oedothorax gibbosus]
MLWKKRGDARGIDKNSGNPINIFVTQQKDRGRVDRNNDPTDNPSLVRGLGIIQSEGKALTTEVAAKWSVCPYPLSPIARPSIKHHLAVLWQVSTMECEKATEEACWQGWKMEEWNV